MAKSSEETLPGHIQWLVDTEQNLITSEGKRVQVLEFRHEDDEEILSAWAKHFRNHYCLDEEIDYFKDGLNCSRAEYLNSIKFPDPLVAPGPSIRSGDFGEILVADYLEYLLDYWVPRTKYGNKSVRNESEKGCDIIGFKILDAEKDSLDDTLAIFEAKAQLSGEKPNPRLQDAIKGSAKDHLRRGESLNAIRQRLFDKHLRQEADLIKRFQNLEDRPYTEIYGAVALFSTSLYDQSLLSKASSNEHPNAENLHLVVIRGDDLMPLVHQLYKRAADEA